MMRLSIHTARALALAAALGLGTLLGGCAVVRALRNGSSELHAEVAFNAQGAPDGVYRLLTASGQLQGTGEFQNGEREGVWTFWNTRGIKLIEITYRDGVKEGPCRMWYGSNAFPASAGNKKLEVAFAADKQQGGKRTWWPSGKLQCETELGYGSVVSTRCWSGSGGELTAAESVTRTHDQLEADAKYLHALDEVVDDSVKKPL